MLKNNIFHPPEDIKKLCANRIKFLKINPALAGFILELIKISQY